jgi:hypothetical protein
MESFFHTLKKSQIHPNLRFAHGESGHTCRGTLPPSASPCNGADRECGLTLRDQRRSVARLVWDIHCSGR